MLVTDGEPNACNSTIQAVANEAASVSAGIPTFVIGIGNTANLDTIAQAGGTSKATIVSTNNAAQTAQDFETALNAIRGLTLARKCQLPAAPLRRDEGRTAHPRRSTCTSVQGASGKIDIVLGCATNGVIPH